MSESQVFAGIIILGGIILIYIIKTVDSWNKRTDRQLDEAKKYVEGKEDSDV